MLFTEVADVGGSLVSLIDRSDNQFILAIVENSTEKLWTK